MGKYQKISKKDLIYQFFQDKNVDDIEYTPRHLAKILQLKYNTVRTYCRELALEQKIQCTKKGKFVFYSLQRDPLSSIATPQKLKIHGLMMHYVGSCSHIIKALGGNFASNVQFGKFRKISKIQVFPSSCSVWVNTTKNPMDDVAFFFFLEFLEAHLNLPVLRGEGKERWFIKQRALGHDLGLKIQENSENIRLSGFLQGFLEYYDKELPDGSSIRRVAIHENDKLLTLGGFLDTLSENLHTIDQTKTDQLIQQLNSLEKTMNSLITILGQKGILDPHNDNYFG